MRILRYSGVDAYTDPRLRFVANTGDTVEFTDEEAEQRLETGLFEEVTDDGDLGDGSGSVSTDDSTGDNVHGPTDDEH